MIIAMIEMVYHYQLESASGSQMKLFGATIDTASPATWIATVAVIAVGIVLIASFYFGSTMGFSTYVPELFPTELRLRGTGVSSVAGRAASILAPQAVTVLYAFDGVNAVVYTLIAMLLAEAVVVGVSGIQANRRSLDMQIVGGH